MITGMFVGALIFLIGLAAGYAAALYLPRFKVVVYGRSADKYDKYRNPDGLLSRKAVREK